MGLPVGFSLITDIELASSESFFSQAYMKSYCSWPCCRPEFRQGFIQVHMFKHKQIVSGKCDSDKQMAIFSSYFIQLNVC